MADECDSHCLFIGQGALSSPIVLEATMLDLEQLTDLSQVVFFRPRHVTFNEQAETAFRRLCHAVSRRRDVRAMDFKNMESRHIYILADELENNETLQVLWLRECDADETSMFHMLRTARSLSALRTLRISDHLHRFRVYVPDALGLLLRTSRTLNTLMLTENILYDSEYPMKPYVSLDIFHALSDPSCVLRHLSLRGCVLAPGSVAVLAAALAVNKRLATLDMSQIKIAESDDCQCLVDALERNTALRGFALTIPDGRPSLPTAVITELVRVLNNHPTIQWVVLPGCQRGTAPPLPMWLDSVDDDTA